MAAHKPTSCLVLQRPQAQAELKTGRDQDWAAVVAAAKAACKRAPCAETEATAAQDFAG